MSALEVATRQGGVDDAFAGKQSCFYIYISFLCNQSLRTSQALSRLRAVPEAGQGAIVCDEASCWTLRRPRAKGVCERVLLEKPRGAPLVTPTTVPAHALVGETG